jgi:MYXO-CTERM domain-containing protein
VALLSDITLVIQNADSPLDLPLTYTFDLYDDDDNAVESSDALDGDPSGETSYTLHSELTENTWYWWEAAADDGWVVGPSTGPQTFFYNTVNEAPGAPGINNPFQGSSVSSIRPTLVLDEATDPDEDILTYSYVLTDTIGNEIETTEGVAGNGLTASWTVSTALTDGATYCWYGWATDPDGLTGPDSDSACFTVDTHNQGPSAPVIISPPDGSSINTETVDIVLTDGVDPEGRGLQHVFQIDTEETFTSEDFQTGTVLSDGSGQTTWTTAPLVDDTWYHVRALASDGAAYSEWATSTFRVKIGNHAPETPELYSPEDEATVASGTPLVVTNAVDADDDPITYYFVVYDMDGNEVQDGDTPEDLSGTTAWTPSQLPYGTYTWTVRAVDVYGFSSDWADPWTFTVGEVDTGECTGKFCEDGTLMGGGCGCTTPGTATAGVAWLAVAGALALSRRQR